MLLAIEIHRKLQIHPDRHRFSEFPIRLGRSIQCELFVDDKSVSGIHAVVERRADGLWLIDQQSVNGIYVNGHRIKEVLLSENMTVHIGSVAVRFLVNDEDLAVTRILETRSPKTLRQWVWLAGAIAGFVTV